ncbi:MAG: hypothetical protein ACM34I_01330 [bacterium]
MRPPSKRKYRKTSGVLFPGIQYACTTGSFLLVFLADNLPDGPFAGVHLRHRSPYSMHGFWYDHESSDCGC